jgi:vesicle coat complex subunit
VLSRARPPLLTLITGAQPEIQFTVLKHLELLCRHPAAQGVFDDEYRQLFVRYNEPAHVKHLKVDILPLIANDLNARDIAGELGVYVTDVDAELSKRSIAAVAHIGIRVASVSLEVAQQLVELVDLDVPYVRTEATKALVDVLRVFPSAKRHVLPFLSKFLSQVEDADARAAVLWMLGEYGEEVLEAPYLLERAINGYASEQSSAVRLQMLTAAVKLFFKRPPEMQAMLGTLFKAALDEGAGSAGSGAGNQDVHDRALLYYRLLNADVAVAAEIFKVCARRRDAKKALITTKHVPLFYRRYPRPYFPHRRNCPRTLPWLGPCMPWASRSFETTAT